MAARSRAALTAAVALAAVAPRPARADGAFPDSGGILLPAGRPAEMALATNFGIIASSDGGTTWGWVCETALAAMGQGYQLGGATRILAWSLWGAIHSDDGACSWTAATGDIARATVTDLFGDGARALALAVDPDQPAGLPQLAYASDDGGGSFGAAIFRADDGASLLGIESARSDPRTLYLSLAVADGAPRLLRSRDGGVTWTSADLAPSLGNAVVRIIAVDPADSDLLFLRVSGAGGDRLAISRDGGATVQVALAAPGSLTAFVRRAGGAIIVAGVTPEARGFLARSDDGGRSFATQATAAPRFRALAERDGVLFGAGDNFADGFALGVSGDDGVTWRPLLTFDRVLRVKPCVAAACQADCRRRAGMGLWPATVCGDAPSDGGPVTDGGRATDGPAPASIDGGGAGCACGAGGLPGWGCGGLSTVGLAIALARRPRRPATRARRGELLPLWQDDPRS